MMAKCDHEGTTTISYVHEDQVKKDNKDKKYSGYSVVKPTLSDIPA